MPVGPLPTDSLNQIRSASGKRFDSVRSRGALEHFPIMLGRIRRRRSSWCIRLD
jgi:hypothetical protein